MSIKANGTPDRLKRRSDFLRVQGAERKWVSPTVIVQVAAPANPERQTNIRYGITATKKLGGAVKRNRVKRRLRAAVRAVLAEGQSIPADIVLIGRGETATCVFGQLVRDLRWCLKRLEVSVAKKTD